MKPSTSIGWSLLKWKTNEEDPEHTFRNYYSAVKASFRDPAFSIQLHVPVLGKRQHTVGPCLLPVFPKVKEWPAPLKILVSIELESGNTVFSLDPNDLNITVRQEDLSGGYSEKRLQPIHGSIYANGRDMITRENRTGTWDRGNPAIRFNADFHILIAYPLYDTEFKDFRLEPFRLNGSDGVVMIPAAQFRRHSDLEYIPYTTQILDL